MPESRTLVAGRASGIALVLDEPLSFWGGLDPETGTLIDTHHPQRDAVLTDRILVMPSGRGSSSSSYVLAEAIRAGRAPAAIVLREGDGIVALGAIVARELYGATIPVVALDTEAYGSISDGMAVDVHANRDEATVVPSRHDRGLLLAGVKRDAMLELWEVQRYGADSFGDADYVSVYGMPPADWYRAGIRMLGRTAVECTRDRLAEAIAIDVASVAGSGEATSPALVIDPFAGSANTLFWIMRSLPGARGLGFELDERVFELARRNLSVVSSPIELAHTDYAAGLADVTPSTDGLLIVFVAPPWGDALDPTFGLDLRRTTPPVAEIMDMLFGRFPGHRLLLAIQVYERCDPASLAELEARFDWSDLRIYDLDTAGAKHGIMLGTRGWVPSGG
jgi:predicted aconitase with swiveling domain